MVSTQYETILKEFEAFFQCPLAPDQNNSCLIKLNNGLAIQIELNKNGQVLVGTRLGVLPMSRFRDNVFREALKSNEVTLPSTGIFAFSQKSNNLILFLAFDPSQISAEKILGSLPPFIAKAKQWMDALAAGTVPTVEQAGEGKAKGGIFSLL